VRLAARVGILIAASSSLAAAATGEIGGAPGGVGDGGSALDALILVLRDAGADLRSRTERLLPGRLDPLLLRQEGSSPELRRALGEAREAAHLDLLYFVSDPRGAGGSRVVAASEELSARTRIEESAEGRELAAALAAPALAGGGRSAPRKPPRPLPDLRAAGPDPGPTSFEALPPWFLARFTAGAGLGVTKAEPVLVLTFARRLSGGALVSGIRLSVLERSLERALQETAGRAGLGWCILQRGSAPSTDEEGRKSFFSGPAPRIVLGEGAGRAVPHALLAALDELDRTVWPRVGNGSSPPAESGWARRSEWRALRSASGETVGGLGLLFPPSPSAASTPVSQTRDSWSVPEVTALFASIFLIGLALLVLRGARWERRAAPKPRARGSDYRAAVDRAGEVVAGAVSQRLVEAVERRLREREEPARKGTAPAPAAAPGEGARRSILDTLPSALLSPAFPLALWGVDERMEIFFWNPAAERLWNARQSERRGRRLETLAFGGLETEIRERAFRATVLGVVEPPARLSFDRDRVYHLELAAIPLLLVPPKGTGAPRPVGALLVAEEVSQVVDREFAAKALNRYQKALSASLPIPLVVVDGEGRVVSWNVAMEAYLGVSERGALGKRLEELPLGDRPHATFPFAAAGGERQGTLHLFGDLASSFDPAEALPSGR
jgi:PAS domain-containing protein